MVTYLSGSFLVVAISPYKSQLSNGIFYVHIIYIHSDVHVAETDAEPCIYIYDICIHCTIQDTLQYTPFKPHAGLKKLWPKKIRDRTPKGVIQEQDIYIYIPRTLVLIGISALSWGVWPSKIGVIGALFFHCQTCRIAHFPTMAHVWLEMPRRRLEPRVQPQMPWIFCDLWPCLVSPFERGPSSPNLVGGWTNPSEKYLSNCKNRDENK